MLHTRPVRVLLVEDDPAHAEIIQRNLEQTRVPHQIVHVEDGQLALEYLYRQGQYADQQERPAPDLVVLDLRLPRVNGLEVLHRIKSDQQLKKMPVVILTTSDSEVDMVQAYNSGAGSYLVKPVSFEQFSTLMQVFGVYWLTQNRYPE